MSVTKTKAKAKAEAAPKVLVTVPDTMIASRKYRLDPTREQAALMAEFFGAYRAVHNVAVQQRNDAYKLARKSVSYKIQAHDLKEVRDDAEVAPWLKRVPAQILQQSLKNVEVAYDRFFKGVSGYPNFHAKGQNDAFRQPQHVKVRRVSKKWAEVSLQNLGWVRFRLHRPLDGELRNATVKLKAGQYFVSFPVVMADRHDDDNGGVAVGGDLGVAHTVATSDGEFFDMPEHRPGEDERLRRLQRQLSRQVKGSRRREKTKLAIAKIYARQAKRRRDFAHKVSHTLATTHSLVGTEDLKVKNMTKSAAGTVESPGRNVAAKRGLNKAIREQCWGLIGELLDYKCEWYGSYHSKCNAAYSSQECSRCGHTHEDNRKTQALFICAACGYTTHADTNAANVIKERNVAIAAGERAAMRALRAEDVKTKREAMERRRAQRDASGELAAWLAIVAKQKLEQENDNCSTLAGPWPTARTGTARGQRVAARGGSEVLARRNENLALGDSIPAPELLPSG